MIIKTVLPVLYLLAVAQVGTGRRKLISNNDTIKQNKHLVQLEITAFTNSKFHCSGSIISNRLILTAAHCIHDAKNAVIQHLRGHKFFKIADADDFFMKDKSYDENDHAYENMEKDLGVILTRQRIVFNDQVQPIAIGKLSGKNNDSAVMSGYNEIKKGIYLAKQEEVLFEICDQNTTLLCCNDTSNIVDGISGGSLVYKGKLIGVMIPEESNSSPRAVYLNVVENKNWITDMINIF